MAGHFWRGLLWTFFLTEKPVIKLAVSFLWFCKIEKVVWWGFLAEKCVFLGLNSYNSWSFFSFACHVVSPRVCAGSGFAKIWVINVLGFACLRQHFSTGFVPSPVHGLLVLFWDILVQFLPSAFEEIGVCFKCTYCHSSWGLQQSWNALEDEFSWKVKGFLLSFPITFNFLIMYF